MTPITTFNAPELDIFTRTPEVQLLTYHEPKPGLFLAETARVILRGLDSGYQPVSLLVEEELLGNSLVDDVLERVKALSVPIYTAPKNILSQMTGYHLNEGILCAMGRKSLPSLDDICKNAKRIAVLEGVVNPTNVGAIFRSAAALHMDAALLTSDCTDPLYRRAIRVSMGNVFLIPWTKLEKGVDVPTHLRKLGYTTVAMALTDESVSMADERLKMNEKIAIFLGNEGDGLSDETIKACDYTAKIPMTNGVDSLNVAAASAVAFWELGGRR